MGCLTYLGDDALPNGLDVTFEVTELRRLTGSYNTMVGNNEGSMVRALPPFRVGRLRVRALKTRPFWKLVVVAEPFTLLNLYLHDDPWFLIVFLESIVTCFGLFEDSINISHESGTISFLAQIPPKFQARGVDVPAPHS